MRTKLSMALRQVGAAIMECRRQGNTHGTWEGTQYKAEADLIADAALRRELKEIADIEIVSEEDVKSQSRLRPHEYWLIDPIDGTASFVQGYAGFVCQVALMQDGRPQLAGVFAPALDKLFIAGRGKGATLNGESIRVRATNLSQLVLVDNYPEPRGLAEKLFQDLQCAEYLESGSIGLKICLVAEGVADIFVKDVTVRDWDIAAPHLILEEAGGFLTQHKGVSFNYVGDYERQGLVAVSSIELQKKVSDFVATYST